MKHYYTALIEYDRPEDMPRVHAGMEALGGKVIAVHFDDMFKELERIEAEREACAKVCEQRGDGWLEVRNARTIDEGCMHSAAKAEAIALAAAIRARSAKCKRAICQRGTDGYCAVCHKKLYPGY